MLFSDIIGQEDIKTQMLSSLRERRIPHAQLISGPAGCGKLPLALAYATALLCHNPVGCEACGHCRGCKMTQKLEHPDLHFVFPVKDSKKVSDNHLPAWRQLLLESPYFDAHEWYAQLGVTTQQPHIYVSESDQILRKISLSSNQGGYRVMIIWHPERMNVQAANKLLKILEEPMPGTAFLLVSDQPENLLDTIVSRTVRLTCTPLSAEQISQALVTRYGLAAADANSVARSSNGSFTKALIQITTRGEEAVFLDMFMLLMRAGFARRVRELQQWTDTVVEWGREKQRRFLLYMHHLVRESFVHNLSMPQLNYINKDEAQFLSRFSPYVNERNVEGFTQEIDAAIRDVTQNGNAKMIFFDLALQCIVLVHR